MGARAIAWCTLIMISLIIVTALYFVTSSGIAFFEHEAKEAVGRLRSAELKAPWLEAVVEQTLRFVKSFIWTIFILLVVALIVSLLVLWLEDVASR